MNTAETYQTSEILNAQIQPELSQEPLIYLFYLIKSCPLVLLYSKKIHLENLLK